MASELANKTEWVFNEKRGKWQRKSPLTKNELYRRMLTACAKNQTEFRYVLGNVWYSSSENMSYIKEELLDKEFSMPLKANRKVALFLKVQTAGRLGVGFVSRVRTGQSTGSLRTASGVHIAFGQAGLQERGR